MSQAGMCVTSVKKKNSLLSDKNSLIFEMFSLLI
jgi:hypothetical protein